MSMTVSVLWLFLMVPLVGLQCVIEVFPDHTQLLFIGHLSYVDLITLPILRHWPLSGHHDVAFFECRHNREFEE